ncbi:hypothetical protein VTP01DRAFT_1600 [Rhizomucor pusillus]|uniref:uncharacterized protein n=1 Tax=Rhizomucor pusillus TaxID=4840 RepID=UPI003743E895
MSRLNQAPPLKNVSPGVIGPVAQHRNEPFLRRQRSRKTRAAVQLLSTFAQLELVLKKASSDKNLYQEADALIDGMDRLWLQMDMKPDKQKLFMQEMRFSTLYPRAMHYFATRTAHPMPPSSKHDLDSHYHHLAQLDQLYTTAVRLHHSLKLNDHTYIPYQLALVYQCVIHLGQDFAEYRGRISQQFEDIRSSVMNAQARHNVPKLAEHHIKWLRELSLDLIHRTNNTNERQTSLVEAMRHVHNIFDDESMKTTAT